MNLHQLPLLVGLVLVAAAAMALVLVDGSLPQVRDPRIPSEEGVQEVRLQVQPIQEFAHYYGTEADPWQDLNPFVPFSQREAERARLGERRRQRNQKDVPPAAVAALPKPPTRQAPVPRPQLKPLPTLDGSDIVVPHVVGYLSGPTGRTITVSFGAGPARALQPGDTHSGWTFVDVRGGTAFFLDADGVEHGFLVADPLSGLTTLGPVDHLSGGGGPGATGAGMIPNPGQLPGGAIAIPDVAELMRQIQQDPRGAAMLQANPDLMQMLQDNPERALNLFERLQLRQRGQR